MTTVVVDAGPLVALIDGRDEHHAWSRKVLGRLTEAPVTCEAVLTEVLFLLRADQNAPRKIAGLFGSGWLALHPAVGQNPGTALALMEAYRNVPMSFADACLVRITESISESVVLTTDSDFHIYRRHRHQAIPLRMPKGR